MHKIAIAGASGRMGQMLIEAVHAADDCTLAGALDQVGSSSVGSDAGAFSGQSTGVVITSDLQQGLQPSQFLIDFTRPEGTLAHLQVCRELGISAVIGTTGFTEAQKAEITRIAQDIAIMMAPNMSVGVNVTLKLLEMAAKALSTGYDIEIVEAHHRMKKDAPSGTALKLGEMVAEGVNRNLAEVGVYSRHGMIGERTDKEIGIQTIRAGDIVGEHTVYFAGAGERLELTHRAHSRDNFARGAALAAAWVAGKPNGLYTMFDVLGLQDI